MNPNSTETPTSSKQKLKSQIQLFATPLAIVAAGAVIALTLYIRPQSAPINSQPTPAVQKEVVAQDTSLQLKNMAPVTDEDHIRGNRDASVKIVEYSDTECPFCKRFHVTMKQLMAEYGESGDVAWVYRHFPIDQLHPESRKQAEATECAAELGGNDAFWKYLDRVYEITPSNNGLKLSQLPEIAEYIGLDVGAFNACLSSGKYAAKVEGHVQDAIATGGNGTPWSIVVTDKGKQYPLSGAQPLSAVKQIIGTALKQ